MADTITLGKTDWLSRSQTVHGVERIEAFFQGSAYGLHRHDTYAIGCTIAGVQAFNYRGAHRQSLPGHTMVLHPDEGFRYRMIYLNPALVQQTLGGRPLPFIEGGTTKNPRLLAASRHLLEQPGRHVDSVEATDTIIELALALQAASGETRKSAPGDFQSAKTAHEFLSDSWQHPVSMAELSAAAGRDRWSVARDFRQFYGTSPSRFLLMRRLDAARRHILAGSALADVAASTGFADQAHMTRHFTQTFGISPARWRRTMQQARCTDTLHAQTFKT